MSTKRKTAARNASPGRRAGSSGSTLRDNHPDLQHARDYGDDRYVEVLTHGEFQQVQTSVLYSRK